MWVIFKKHTLNSIANVHDTMDKSVQIHSEEAFPLEYDANTNHREFTTEHNRTVHWDTLTVIDE
jgi:hypothetical protein